MIIVAEVGSNHCGSLDLALEHIRVARACGADAIKFQLFRASSLESRERIRKKLKPFELPLSWISVLRDEAHKEGLYFIVTPFSPELARYLKGKVDMVKVSAYDITFFDLLKEVGSLGLPVILSTAMASMDEVREAVLKVLAAKGTTKEYLYLLHGVAAYPARKEDFNLLALRKMVSVFGAKVGISDHTPGVEVAQIATALGAEMIEKHFRLEDLPKESPDKPVSTTPSGFKEMVEKVKEVKTILGSGYKVGPLDVELPLYHTCRRTNSKRLRG